MNFLQKLGKSFFLPLVCLPVCGLLMGLGYFMCPAGMQNGEIVGFTAHAGFLLIKAGSAVIDNMAFLFAIGVGIGLSDDDAVGGVAAFISWFMITTLLNTDNIVKIVPLFAEHEFYLSAFDKIQNPFIGILSGIIGAKTFMRFKHTRLPAWLGFFSGKRLTVILSGLFSVAAAAILAVVWPLLFAALVLLGRQFVKMGNFGCALYAMLNRLLIPFGLHHALNSVILFDTIGIGDLTAFWAGQTSADVSWSLGMYMSGFFAPTMIGIPGAALAMYYAAKKDRRKKAAGILFSSAVTAFVCGITEPFEFSFMISCPQLYFVYSVLYGVFTYISCVTGFRAGFSFSAGLSDLIFSSTLPAAQKTWLFIPLGIAAFVVFYLVFHFMIRTLDLKTIGREEDSAESTAVPAAAASADQSDRAARLIRALGGAGNIQVLSNCATRLRLTLHDSSLCSANELKAAGALGVFHPSKNTVHVIIGAEAQFVAEEMKALMAAPAAAEPVKPASDPNVLQGTGVGTGIAIAPLYFCEKRPAITKTPVSDCKRELARFENALLAVRARLAAAKDSAAPEASAILEAQLLLLEDASLTDAVRAAVAQGVNAEYAAVSSGNAKAAELEAMDNAYLRERGTDVRDVCNMLADELTGYRFSAAPETPSIFVADTLSPEELSALDRSNVVGIVTRAGSAVNHTSILAGNYGLPYVFGIEPPQEYAQGAPAVLDAEAGKLWLAPGEAVLRDYRARKTAAEKALASAADYRGAVRLYANIGSAGDVKDALANGAEGIGLFRTEFLYMNRKTLPDEEEQFKAYKSAAEAMQGREVIIRTMDIGADKKTDCIPLPHEENPALGKRAIRICLDEPELFRTQLRALLRAAVFGDLRIMYPMISSEEEILDIRDQVKLAAEELDRRGEKYRIPPQGIMIETPAAAVLSDELAGMTDFFSIGTNDLLQYTTALDRQGEGLERFYNARHKALFRLIEMTVKNAHKHGIPVGICGELGGDAEAAVLLAKLGVDELSMSPFRLNAVRAALYRAQADEAKPSSREELGSPADGELVPMSDIPDEAFSSGLLGKCVGVIPANGGIYAPCDGTVTMLHDTLHAIGIRSANGNDVLLHIGIDTVSLGGEGFRAFIKPGDSVKKGDRLMDADIDLIRSKGLDPIVIMAVTE